MPLTHEGFQVRRFDEVNSNLISNVESQLNTKISRDADSVITILLNNVSSELTDLNELAKAVYDSFDIYKAEGTQLDNRCAQIGIYRLGERASTGYVQITFEDDEVLGKVDPRIVQSGSILTTEKGNRVTVDNPASIATTTGCYSFEYELAAVNINSTEQININGDIYAYVTGDGETKEEVMEQLVTAIESNPNKDYTVERGTGATMKVTYISETGNGLIANILAGVDSTLKTVVGTVKTTCTLFGEIIINAQEVNLNITPIDGAISLTNEEPFISGSSVETDAELRERYLSSLQATGDTTADAIQDRLSKLSGVTSVTVRENTTNTEVEGRPANSFEAIVSGGEDKIIAQAIWDSKPASATAHGTLNKAVLDIEGKEQYVKFSRPIPVYVWIEVTYQLYSEEAFPTDGRTRIVNALQEHSSELALGEDIYPQKLLGSIYSSTDGLGTVTTRVATSLSPNVLVPDNDYTDQPVPMDSNQQPVILGSKVTFITP